MSNQIFNRAILGLMAIAILPAAAWAASAYQQTFDAKHGGSACYFRTYDKAFRKKHPNVKLTAISLGRRATTSNGAASSAKKFGLAFSATTAAESYSSIADCKPAGAGFTCSLTADGGTFKIVRTKPNIRIVTRRIQLEGFYKNLDISSARGKSDRSFALKGSKGKTCDEVFD